MVGVMIKVKCKGCGTVMGEVAFQLHKSECRPPQPGDRFLAGGKTFRRKPNRPPDLDAPPIRAVAIIFRVLSNPPAPMLVSDAFYLLEKGKLYRRASNSLKEFCIVDELELLLEGNELQQLLDKARRAGARL
jgi:hypothetical protein